MENLDITTIVTRVQALNNSTPVVMVGQGDEGYDIDASALAATVVGAALACHCPIPPRYTPMATSYFASTFGAEIRAVLSRINESVNIRTQVAYDAAASVWIDRYEMVHRPCNVETLLLRLATAPDTSYSNKNFVRPLLGSLNEEQKAALDKIVKSVNLTCSSTNTKGSIFDK